MKNNELSAASSVQRLSGSKAATLPHTQRTQNLFVTFYVTFWLCGFPLPAQQIYTNYQDEVIRVFPSQTAPPDSSSKLFQDVRESISTNLQYFNFVTNTTRLVEIEAPVVVLDEAIADGLFARYNGAQDITSLVIRARKVIVRSAVQLYGTDIDIFAEELSFENSSAAVLTIPTAPPKPGVGQPGIPGQRAGNIRLFVDVVNDAEPGTIRFVTKGGLGGAPGDGANGADGKSLPVMLNYGNPGNDRYNPEGIPPNSMVYIVHNHVPGPKDNCDAFDGTVGSPDYPTSGSDAVAGGKPGLGGQGGSVLSTFDVSAECDVSGGFSGIASGHYIAGKAGQPTTATHVNICRNDYRGETWWHLDGIVSTHDGVDTDSPEADAVSGPDGAFSLAVGTVGWITAGYLREETKFARAVYSTGHYSAAKTEYQYLENTITNLLQDNAWTNLALNDQILIYSLLSSVEANLGQLRSGRTIDNVPFNWAGLLPLQYPIAAYRQEIQTACQALFLDYLVQSSTTSIQQKLSAMVQARLNALSDVQAQAQGLQSMIQAMVALKSQADAITISTTNLQNTLQQLSDMLVRQAAEIQQDKANAQKVPLWEQVLKIGAAVATMIPQTAPVGLIINDGLNAYQTLGTVDWSTPWNDISQLGDLAKSMQGILDASKPQSFADGANLFNQELTNLNLSNISSQGWPAYLKNLQKIGQPVADGIKQISSMFSQTSISQAQVDAYVAQIKAASPAFTSIADDLASLMKQKQQFGEQAAQLTQQIASARDAITKDLIAVAAFDRQISAGVGVLDNDAARQSSELADMARQRLARYQHLMAASWAYLMLTPYPGQLDLDQLESRLQSLVEAGQTNLSQADITALVNVFSSDLSSLADQIVSYYEANALPSVLPAFYDLDSGELATLNAGQAVVLNPRKAGILFPNQQNARLLQIKAYTIAAGAMPGQSLGKIANIIVNFEHQGISRFRLAGKEFEFQNYNAATVNPVRWGVSFDALHGFSNDIQPSWLTASILDAVLGTSQGSNVGWPFYSMGFDGDIVIRMQVNTDNGAKLQLNKLGLQLNYQFTPEASGQATLVVESPGNGIPLGLTPPDNNAAGTGTNTFIRAYNIGTSVTINSPPSFQQSKFQKWRLDGTDWMISPSATLVMGTDHRIEAVYAPADQPTVSVSPTGLTNAALPGQPIASQNLKVWNSGNNILTYTLSSYNDWVSLISTNPLSLGPTNNIQVNYSSGLPQGTYNGTIILTPTGKSEASMQIPVQLTVSPFSTATNVTLSIKTVPSGLSFTFDGTNYTSPHAFTLPAGAPHIVGTPLSQSGSSGTRFIWNAWSDGGTPSHQVIPTSSLTCTADFTTQYFLAINASAGGTVGPVSDWYNAGRVVPIIATPLNGYSFKAWTGSDLGAYSGLSSSVNITMGGPIGESASFTISNGTAFPVMGKYSGLFYESDRVRHLTSGLFSMQLAAKGQFTAKLLTGGKAYSFSGAFKSDGASLNSIPRSGSNPLVVALQLDLVGGETLSGQIGDGLWTAELLASRTPYSKTNPAPQAGTYTFVIAGTADSATEPGGNGFGTVVVSASGNVVFKGTLGDATAASQKAQLSSGGLWPLYLSLYSGNGSMLGWLTFANQATDDITGRVNWIKSAQPGARLYPTGFETQREAIGSVYNPPSKGRPVMNFSNAELILENGGLFQNITNSFSLDANSKVTNQSSNKMNLSFTLSSGLFKGSVVIPGSAKGVRVRGAVLSKQTNAFGFFSEGAQSGSAFLRLP